MSKNKQHHDSAVGKSAETQASAEGSAAAAAPAGASGRGTSHAPQRRLPVALLVAFGGLLAAGIIWGATKDLRAEAAIWQSINECDAKTIAMTDGLNDFYGVVRFRFHPSDLGKFLTLCNSQPALAHRIFRKAMDEGSTSAKLVAMYSAFYLTLQGQLESDDFKRIVDTMNADTQKDPDLLRAAQRAVSDLTVIGDAGHEAQLEVVPAGLPEPEKDPKSDTGPLPHKVQVKESKLSSGKAVLLVRWSSPIVAHKWWQAMAGQGAWDKGLQRFVIPNQPAEQVKVR